MAQFIVSGVGKIDICVTVEADSMEDAKEIVENNITLAEYCDGNIGIDYYSDDAIEDVELYNTGYDIDWEVR